MFVTDQSEKESGHHRTRLRARLRHLLLAHSRVYAILLLPSEGTRVLQRVLALSQNCRILSVLSQFLCESRCFVLGQRDFQEALQQVGWRKTFSTFKIRENGQTARRVVDANDLFSDITEKNKRIEWKNMSKGEIRLIIDVNLKVELFFWLRGNLTYRG